MNDLYTLDAPQLYTQKEDICSIVTDKNGLIMGINSKFSEVCGYDLMEVIGKPHSMFFDSDFETVIEDILLMVSNGNDWEGYVKKLTKCGESFWVHLTANSIGVNGDFLSICRIVLDEEMAELTAHTPFAI